MLRHSFLLAIVLIHVTGHILELGQAPFGSMAYLVMGRRPVYYSAITMAGENTTVDTTKTLVLYVEVSLMLKTSVLSSSSVNSLPEHINLGVISECLILFIKCISISYCLVDTLRLLT